LFDQCLDEIDGFGPISFNAPRSAVEVGDLVRSALADNQAIYPFGGRTMFDYGLPPTRPGFCLDLRNLCQVIDYPARDMTITVQAGITVSKLQELLASENQRLPIDVPQPDRATLGGIIATNVSGPRRYGFGTLRDYVIGISVINDQGQEVKAGGRVVKNVAGYDLCKLYIGSLGTLGIITQVTLKLKPRPEEQALILIACGQDKLDLALDEVHHSRTRPVCVDLLNPGAAAYIKPQAGVTLPEDTWVLAVGFEDNRESVQWQIRQLLTELSAAGFAMVETRTGEAAEPLWRMLAEFPAREGVRVTFKANILPRTTAAFCRQASALSQQLMLQAHAGNGIVIGHARSDLTLEQARRMLNVLQNSATAAEGNVIVPRCPSDWKREIPIWGIPRGDMWLMRAIKEKLDPRRLFNPCRFVDGL
jgi:glycolate dehydrogenase FAD-binding subunit